jgi:hypothetical protein
MEEGSRYESFCAVGKRTGKYQRVLETQQMLRSIFYRSKKVHVFEPVYKSCNKNIHGQMYNFDTSCNTRPMDIMLGPCKCCSGMC